MVSLWICVFFYYSEVGFVVFCLFKSFLDFMEFVWKSGIGSISIFWITFVMFIYVLVLIFRCSRKVNSAIVVMRVF